jgi:hypothetical protein
MWGLIGFAWGDTLASLDVLKRNNIDKVIHIGPYPEIKDFLEAQSFITDVKCYYYDNSNKAEYMKTLANLANRIYESHHIPQLHKDLKMDFCEVKDIKNCLIDWTSVHYKTQLPDKVDISNKSINKAKDIAKNLPKDFILLQPQSLHTNKQDGHYPHWNLFITAISDKKNVVTIGENKNSSIPNNFIDLRGEIDSAEVFFELVKYSKCLITVPNNLYNYCQVIKHPTLSLNHDSFNSRNPFFRMSHSKNTYNVMHGDTVEKALSYLDDILKGKSFDPHNFTTAEYVAKFTDITLNDYTKIMKSHMVFHIEDIFNTYINDMWFFDSSVPDWILYESARYLSKTGSTYPSIKNNMVLGSSIDYLKSYGAKSRSIKKTSKQKKILFACDNVVSDYYDKVIIL